MTLQQVHDSLNIHSASIPIYLETSFTADDTDNHDFIFSGNGKSVQTIHVNNASDQTATVTLYGCQSESSTVGSTTAVQIGSFTVSSTSGGYECCSDPFPYYIVRIAYSSTPDGSTTKLFVNTGVD